jgi:undecaprenyl-diphosphatase
MGASTEEPQDRVRRVVETALEHVDSPESADEVLERIERLAAGETEAERGERAAAAPTSAASAVEHAAEAATTKQQEAAAVLTTAAAEAVAPTAEAPQVLKGAQEALGTRAAPAAPAADRGRELLKEAALRRMSPLEALDSRLFLAINNGLPHPRWVDTLLDAITTVTRGGWIWVGGVLLAHAIGTRRGRAPTLKQAWKGWPTVRVLLPTVVGATWILEYPVKAYFRRRRPFVDVVRALVVGKKPGSWSFPSGHTASSFAASWVLSSVWPRQAPLFYTLATLVGLSRIYAGAHYPGDVLSGALYGSFLAEILRRCVYRLLR